MITAHTMTLWVEVVIRLAVTVLPEGDGALILGSKTLRQQRKIDTPEGLRAKELDYSELADSENGLASVLSAGSAVPFCLWRVKLTLGVVQTISNAEEASTTVECSFTEELLARRPGTVIESELE